MPRTWSEWTNRQLAFLDENYPTSMPIATIAERVGHSVNACKMRAGIRGLRRPLSCSAQAVRNFETDHGKPLAEIAREYRDRRLSRSDLAGDIGIINQTLRKFLPDELWHSWPRMTIGRIDEARRRRKAA